jgi:hypothetical protein
MEQDYSKLTDDQIELIEKQSLRVVVQAIQEYSREAKEIFDNTNASSGSEVIVLAEDLVQYALEVAETYPINKRFAGFIDYKRVRWLPSPFGLFPQVLLVDAKASTENNRDTLQQSQLPLDADFLSNGQPYSMKAGVPPHMEICGHAGSVLKAITTSLFVHFYYEDVSSSSVPYRKLKAIYALAIPHARLKSRYNPSANKTFFGQGKHSPARKEVPRIRVYFSRLQDMCPWRFQKLVFSGAGYAKAVWQDGPSANMTVMPFDFLGR